MTIWSVVGIPPVLLAGIWGMNFHFMPELAWHLWLSAGDLATIVLSVVMPLVWFKCRGWW